MLQIDSLLTAKIKEHALHTLNADLVGVANIERFEHAPLVMSPQGILPTAKSVIVMAVHHPDGAIEMGGREHPQVMGPYGIQCAGMNHRLDEISYRMALFLEDQGFSAVPIVASNIWRYKGYKNLKEHFAPDVSHMHMAVAAGLAEFGYNGLAITPEYGARNRFVTVITDAVLEPSPLLKPGSVCDNCMLCRKHCLSGALSKEIDGWNIVKIEDKEYRYAKKNLWRCAWGEHFDLDLDAKIPDQVDEEVILKNLREHGKRGGEMGSCLRYCVPKNLRYFDRDYTNAPRRKKHYTQTDLPLHRGILERVRSSAARWGIDHVLVSSRLELEAMGIDPAKHLPDTTSAITMVLHYREPENPARGMTISKSEFAASHRLIQAGYDSMRILERLGYSTVLYYPGWGFPTEKIEAHIENIAPGRKVNIVTVLTSADLPSTGTRLPDIQPQKQVTPGQLRQNLEFLARECCMDLVGIAPADRFKNIRDSIAPEIDGEKVFNATDKAPPHFNFDPEVTEEEKHVLLPDDYLPGARSVLVMGIRLPRATVEITARTPAEAVGPLAFAQFESTRLLELAAIRAVRVLEDRGIKAIATHDLMNTGSLIATPRGQQPDAFCNRFAAVAAGLGRLSKCGTVVTPGFGTNVRFVAVVLESELPADAVLRESGLTSACETCDLCLKSCHAGAFNGPVRARIDGITETFHSIKRARCDWAKRYSLSAESGNKFMAWQLDVPIPETITRDNLAEALRQQPPTPKHRPCNFEKCVLSCPYTRAQ